jgi:hypothetical protein
MPEAERRRQNAERTAVGVHRPPRVQHGVEPVPTRETR